MVGRHDAVLDGRTRPWPEFGRGQEVADVESLPAVGEQGLRQPTLRRDEVCPPAAAMWSATIAEPSDAGSVTSRCIQGESVASVSAWRKPSKKAGLVSSPRPAGAISISDSAFMPGASESAAATAAPSEWPTRWASAAPSSTIAERAASTSASKLASSPSGLRPCPGRSIASCGRVSGRSRLSGRHPLRSAQRPWRNTIGAPCPRVSHSRLTAVAVLHRPSKDRRPSARPLERGRRGQRQGRLLRGRAAGCARAGRIPSRQRERKPRSRAMRRAAGVARRRRAPSALEPRLSGAFRALARPRQRAAGAAGTDCRRMGRGRDEILALGDDPADPPCRPAIRRLGWR